jgi:hypothetical protein
MRMSIVFDFDVEILISMCAATTNERTNKKVSSQEREAEQRSEEKQVIRGARGKRRRCRG